MLWKTKPVKWVNVPGVEGDRLVYQPTAWSLKPKAIRINVALSFKNPLMNSVKWKRKNAPEVRECRDSPGLRALEMLGTKSFNLAAQNLRDSVTVDGLEKRCSDCWGFQVDFSPSSQLVRYRII